MPVTSPLNDDGAEWIQIHFRLDRLENPVLFDYLALRPKGLCRTTLLKLLAHEGMRGLLLQESEFRGGRASAVTPLDAICGEAPGTEASDHAAQLRLPLDESTHAGSVSVGTAAGIFDTPSDELPPIN